jgi:benzoylformate decarboxylase
MNANLTNRDAIEVPKPYVKWSNEPTRAQDVPYALAQGIHHASLAPSGPAFVSIPMDDWEAEIEDGDFALQTRRSVGGRAQPDPAQVAALAERLRSAERPALVAGPDVDASGGWEHAIELAEQQRLPVWASPPTGGNRLGFPEDHPAFQGMLPPAVGPVGQFLAQYDFVLVAGSSVFPYYPNIPGELLADGTALVAITSDPDEAARAPMGDAIVADVALTLRALIGALDGPADREPPPQREPAEEPEFGEPMSGGAVHATLKTVFPDDGIIVLESPSSTTALRNQLRLSRSGSYYFAAGGGLGFGLSASIGVQLAQPNRQVVCVLGEGSAQYAITAFWTAAAYDVPIKFLVLRNNDYSILKWFASLEQVEGAPALDLPGLDVAATAQSYGVEGTTVSGRDALHAALTEALAAPGPRLVQVEVESGMSVI